MMCSTSVATGAMRPSFSPKSPAPATREFQGHIEEIYGVEASPSLISAITTR